MKVFMPGKNFWKLSKVWGNISKYAKWTLHSKDFSYSSKNIIDPDITIYHSTVLLTSTSILRNKMFFFVLSREAHFLSQQVSSVSSMNTWWAGASCSLSLVLSIVTLKDHFLSLQVSTVCRKTYNPAIILMVLVFSCVAWGPLSDSASVYSRNTLCVGASSLLGLVFSLLLLHCMNNHWRNGLSDNAILPRP